jgi:hypothetical protein
MRARKRCSLLVVPLKHVPSRIAKFDVRLREEPLWAVYAMRTILERMVLFDCTVCREGFPTFHPAYDPSQRVDLHLLRRGEDGVAACNIEVATWDDVPPLDASAEDLLVASVHEGTCRACHVDIRKQIVAQGGKEDGIVPRRSYLNQMNPMYGFPAGGVGQDLRDLFSSATVLEAMLVALEHMQVNFVSARRTHLPKFMKNVISFPQDFAGFARRLGLLNQYRPMDRVNSVRGPGRGVQKGDVSREPKLAREASLEDKQRYGEDERGYLVYPAEVLEVLPDGKLHLKYDFGLGEDVEMPEQVWPRIHMPWHPRFLKGQTKILLQRNIGRGRKLEGLEVRWGYLTRILGALTTWGRWHMGEADGPMHKYYDKRLFHLMSEAEVLAEYAPTGADGNPTDVTTADGLLAAGFDVSFYGPGIEAEEEPAEEEGCEGGEESGWAGSRVKTVWNFFFKK